MPAAGPAAAMRALQSLAVKRNMSSGWAATSIWAPDVCTIIHMVAAELYIAVYGATG